MLEFSTALVDILLLNPEGLYDKRVMELGRECGLSEKESRRIVGAMCRVYILGYEYTGKTCNRDELIWKIRERRKGRGKDLKKRKKYPAGRSRRAK